MSISQSSKSHFNKSTKIGTLSVHVGSLNEVSKDTPNYNSWPEIPGCPYWKI